MGHNDELQLSLPFGSYLKCYLITKDYNRAAHISLCYSRSQLTGYQGKNCLLYQKNQNTSRILADQSRVLGVQKYLQSICKTITNCRLKSLTFSTLQNPVNILHASKRGTKII